MAQADFNGFWLCIKHIQNGVGGNLIHPSILTFLNASIKSAGHRKEGWVSSVIGLWFCDLVSSNGPSGHFLHHFGFGPRRLQRGAENPGYITEALAKVDKVELRNFGVFEVKIYKARVGRNPKKPEKDVMIPARALVKFKAGKEMHAEVLKLTPKQ